MCYLESALIQKAFECKTVDSENKTTGNQHNLDRYEAKLLDQYLDEAYFILELIGVNVFSKQNTQNNIPKNVIPSIPQKTSEEVRLRAKGEVIKYLRTVGINLDREVTYASYNDNKKHYWLNPKIDLLKENWFIVLNNQTLKKIYILHIPKNTFRHSYTREKGCLLIRKDKPYYLDMNIMGDSFVDSRSTEPLKQYIESELNY